MLNVFGLVTREMWIELAIYSTLWLASVAMVTVYIRHLHRILVQDMLKNFGMGKLAIAVLSGGMEISDDREKKLMQIFTIQQP